MKTIRISPVLPAALLLAVLGGCGGQDSPQAPSGQRPPAAVQAGPSELAPAGEKNSLPDGGWFTWQFAEKPALGTDIVKVQAFDKTGARAALYEVIGEFGMPSMRDHDSGPVGFQLNRKGDYLLPVNIVMTGEWELTIRVKSSQKEIYAGKVRFTV